MFPTLSSSRRSICLLYKYSQLISTTFLFQGGELEVKEIRVTNLTYYKKVTGLLPYAQYDVTVTGFTIAGDGPVEKHEVGKSVFCVTSF